MKTANARVRDKTISPCAAFSFLMGSLYSRYESERDPQEFLKAALLWFADTNHIQSELGSLQAGHLLKKEATVAAWLARTIDNRAARVQRASGIPDFLLPSWIACSESPPMQGRATGYLQYPHDADQSGRHDHFLIHAYFNSFIEEMDRMGDALRPEIVETVRQQDGRIAGWSARIGAYWVQKSLIREARTSLRKAGGKVETGQGKYYSVSDIKTNWLGIEFGQWLDLNAGKLKSSDVRVWVYDQLCDESRVEVRSYGPLKTL